MDSPQPVCQWVPGIPVDQAVGDLLLEIMTPVTIDITLAVQQELQARLEETDRLRKQQVERARYEAELAHQRYLRVHPDHRLVADSLEADWNRKLCALRETCATRLYGGSKSARRRRGDPGQDEPLGMGELPLIRVDQRLVGSRWPNA